MNKNILVKNLKKRFGAVEEDLTYHKEDINYLDERNEIENIYSWSFEAFVKHYQLIREYALDEKLLEILGWRILHHLSTEELIKLKSSEFLKRYGNNRIIKNALMEAEIKGESMAIKPQKSDGKGSLKQLQRLINQNQDLVNRLVQNHIEELKSHQIQWMSPLEGNHYSEYTDNSFIERVGLNIKEIRLREFWPSRGPNWDALAKTDKGAVILVEAKANIPELSSPSSGAGEASLRLIQNSLNATKQYLGIINEVNWAGKYYQYTNRIAHLYFLRELRGIDTFLINIYFVGDESVDGPKTIDEWKGAIKVMNHYLGLSSHKLKKYMADIFIDVNLV